MSGSPKQLETSAHALKFELREMNAPIPEEGEKKNGVLREIPRNFPWLMVNGELVGPSTDNVRWEDPETGEVVIEEIPRSCFPPKLGDNV